MKSRKSLASRYYQLKCEHAPTAMYASGSGSETTINAGCAERRPRRGSISSTTVRSGRKSSRNCGKQSGRDWLEGGEVYTRANIRTVLPREE
jgi:hypothetical protein